MKKILLSLGTAATIVASTTSVISCGTTKHVNGKGADGGNGDSINNNEVNAELFDKASKLSSVETTDHDFLRVGGPNLKTWKDGEITLEPFSKAADFRHAFAELRADDYIEFVFDDVTDIKDFTKRVFYDNTLSPKNNLDVMDAPFDALHFNPYEVKGNKVISSPEVVGTFLTEGMEGSKSFFTLSAEKKNVIRMTFNDIYEEANQHVEAQLIYLRGFRDENKDGVVDLNDMSMTPTFALDGGDMFANYLQERTLKGKKYWFPEWTVGMHDETIKQYVQARYDNPKLDFVAPIVYSEAFKQSDIKWSASFDASILKVGDVLEIMWDGAKNICKVVDNGNHLKMVLFNGHDFQDMDKVNGKDSTHFTATGHVVMPGVPADVHDYEVLRMGTL